LDIKKSLIDVADCVLIIIDVQDHFLAKLSRQKSERLVNRICWLTQIAKVLDVPIVATVEEESRNGGLTASVSERLLPRTKGLEKTVYDLTSQKDILDEVFKTGRRTAVLVGLETDVCVAHSAIGLMQNGFQVVVLADVTDSPGATHKSGLDRIRGAGALVTSLKGLYYEWIRTVSRCNSMETQHLKRIGHPRGIVL
jgi:nicotinamidase-related amidase